MVEVVLAVGILAFAILTILGLFGSLNQRARETTERRTAVGAMDSLANFLRHQNDFSTVYGWPAAGPKKLAFLIYRADDNGNPVASGETQVRARWMELPVIDKANLEAAREGRWIVAELTLSPTLNPIAPASLPASAGAYDKASLVFDIDLFIVPDPDIAPPDPPILSGALAAQNQ